jgi:hypothetical protein
MPTLLDDAEPSPASPPALSKDATAASAPPHHVFAYHLARQVEQAVSGAKRACRGGRGERGGGGRCELIAVATLR